MRSSGRSLQTALSIETQVDPRRAARSATVDHDGETVARRRGIAWSQPTMRSATKTVAPSHHAVHPAIHP